MSAAAEDVAAEMLVQAVDHLRRGVALTRGKCPVEAIRHYGAALVACADIPADTPGLDIVAMAARLAIEGELPLLDAWVDTEAAEPGFGIERIGEDAA